MKLSKNYSVKACDLLQRLPIHQQLSESRIILSKLSPIWQKWLDKNVPAKLSKFCSPVYFGNDTLIIECANAVAATQLKQRQQSLLSYLHKHKLTNIKLITFRLANQSFDFPKSNHKNSFLVNKKSSPTDIAENASVQSNKLNTKALNSIKYCQQQVLHQPLAESLGRLINSLKSDKK